MDNRQEALQRLPKVDEVLKDQRLFLFFEEGPRELVAEAVREEIEAVRRRILATDAPSFVLPGEDEWIDRILARLREKTRRSLRRVINGTGTIVHTNLGRARLSEAAARRALEAAASYSTLEYDVEKGGRGSRHDHVEKMIRRITGAEAAMAVNNNAAAVLLCLAAMAGGKEAVVSRGELVEIGGSFRVPDIMELSGVRLREVGTTNKTKIGDYRAAIDLERTGMLLKVHTSNFKIVGFTAEAGVEELAALGREFGIPVVHDIGSGLLVDLAPYGIEEPTVQESLAAGADLVLFSGDKLLGGPQAGIAAGKKEWIDRMKRHPLARAVRLDKMTLAALEETFRIYIEPEKAREDVPVLSMIATPPAVLKERAEVLAGQIRALGGPFRAEAVPSEAQIGGGSTPDQFLPSFAVALEADGWSADGIERTLRSNEPPVIARILRDRVLLDLRTLEESEFPIIGEALAAAVARKGDRDA